MTLDATVTSTEIANRPWDAVVVGAGPAGTLAAREIARRGKSVLLLDRSAFPRWKVCGCCLNGSALSTLAAVGLGDLPARLGAVPLSGVAIAAGGRTATVRLQSGVALSREAFDAALIRDAIRNGVAFRPTTEARRVGETEIELATGSERIRIQPSILIAADGLNGQLAATTGERPSVAHGSRIGAGTVADCGADSYEPGKIHMAVGRGGYVGLVRLEDGRLDVAAAFDSAFVRAAGGLGNAAVAILREAGFPEIASLADSSWKGTPPLTRSPGCIAGERWFAVGDAAGYVEPFTGEGMAWALASGAAVAPLAVREWSPSLAAEWKATHRRIVQDRQSLCRIVSRVLRSPRLTAVAVRLLGIAPSLSQPVIARLNRPSLLAEPVA